jgi:ketosteroid isomerase-like protein
VDDGDELRRLLDERACERLMVDYAWYVDTGHAARIADLFTPDGLWEGADGGRMEGADAIRRAMAGRQGLTRRTSMHVCTNLRVTLDGPDDATGSCYLLNVRHDDQGEAQLPAPAKVPKLTGIYHDRFVRTPEGWRIAHLRFELRFLRPRSRP